MSALIFSISLLIVHCSGLVIPNSTQADPDLVNEIRSSLVNIQTQLSLRNLEHKHLDTDIDDVKKELEEFNSAVDTIENAVKNFSSLQTTLDSLRQQTTEINFKYTELSKAVKAVEGALSIATKPVDLNGTGVTYTRWGRTTCPHNETVTVYSGYAAGDHYTHKGGGVDLLCLPSDPVFDGMQYDDTASDYGNFVYGAEYETVHRTSPWTENMHDHDVPCVVCLARNKLTSLMIPGRTRCYPGWRQEYNGYLMTEHHSHAKSADYSCVDAEPEALPGGTGDQTGRLLYLVEARCGSLRCPPYVNGREIPCVICTK